LRVADRTPPFTGRVRLLTPKDREPWLSLWVAYNAHGPDGGLPPPEPVTDAIWRRFLDEREPVQAFVAELDGSVIGIVHLTFHRTTQATRSSCRLLDLFVDPAFRQCGVGAALVEKVLATAKEAGADQVYWHVKEENRTARYLYDKIAAASGHLVYRRSL
jgi:GNAT superfamily N-acetyltransferase